MSRRGGMVRSALAVLALVAVAAYLGHVLTPQRVVPVEQFNYVTPVGVGSTVCGEVPCARI